MKCDELQERWFEAYPVEGDQIIPTKVYGKKDTDEAIAELQAENAQLKKEIEFMHSNCQWNAGDGCARLLGEKLAIINENVELKRKNRKLKRALWLARAERAVAEQTVDEWSRYKEKHPCGSWRADPFEYWMQAWICVEKICRKKAEEYK